MFQSTDGDSAGTGNQHLSELLLSRNCFGNSGVAKLSAGLCSNTSITVLDLSEVGMELEGIIALSEFLGGGGAVDSTCTCKTMKLTRNDLSDAVKLSLLHTYLGE